MPRVAEPSRSSTATVVWLLIGGVVIFGWFVGLWRLWRSASWSLRDKIIGALLIPGGLVPALWLFIGGAGLNITGEYCSGGLHRTATCVPTPSQHGPDIVWIVVDVALFVVPLVTAGHLRRAARCR